MHKFTLDVDGSSLLLPLLYCADYVEMIKLRPLLGRGKFSHCPSPNKIVQERSSGLPSMLLPLMHLMTLFCPWLFPFLTSILSFRLIPLLPLLLLLHLSRLFHRWLLYLILFQNQNLGMIYSTLILMMKISATMIWINFWTSFWGIWVIVTTPHSYSTFLYFFIFIFGGLAKRPNSHWLIVFCAIRLDLLMT